MKRLIFLLTIMLIASPAWAADHNLTVKTPDTSPTADDLIYTINDPTGTPGDRRVSLENAAKAMTSTDLIDTANILYEAELDTFTELQSQIADETLLKAGTLTDTKYCIYDSASTDIICNSEGGGGSETNSLETTVTGVADTEIFIGDGADSGAFAVMSGDATLANTGALTIAADAIAAAEITNDTITHAQILDSDQADTKCIWFEDPTADDDFNSIWANKTANDFLITEIWAESDQTVTFDLQIDDGTPADVNGTDLAPAAGEAEDTSLSGDTTLAAGEELDLAITSVASTPTWVSICWTGNWVD